MSELMAIIEQDSHPRQWRNEGAGYRPATGQGQKLDPGNAPEDAPDESQPFDTPMFPKFPGEGDLPAED